MDGGGEKEKKAPLLVRLHGILASSECTWHRPMGPSVLHISGHPVHYGWLDRGYGVSSSSCPCLRNRFRLRIPGAAERSEGRQGRRPGEGRRLAQRLMWIDRVR